MARTIKFDLGSCKHHTRWILGISEDVPEKDGFNQDVLLANRLEVIGSYKCAGRAGGDRISYGCHDAWMRDYSPFYQKKIDAIPEGKDRPGISSFFPFNRDGVIVVRHNALVTVQTWLSNRYRALLLAIDAEANSEAPNLDALEDFCSERRAIYTVASELLAGMEDSGQLKEIFGEEEIWPVDGVRELLTQAAETQRLLESAANSCSLLAEKMGAPGDRVGLKTLAARLEHAAHGWKNVQNRKFEFLPVENELMLKTDALLDIVGRDITKRIDEMSEQDRSNAPLKYAGLKQTQDAIALIRSVFHTTMPKLFPSIAA